MLIELGLGALASTVTIYLFRYDDSRKEDKKWALSLVIAALIYVGFSLVGDKEWLGLEIMGLVLYGALAFLGMRLSPWFLVIGWGFHTAWDLGLHYREEASFVPDWYPIVCLSYDLIVAGYLFVRSR